MPKFMKVLIATAFFFFINSALCRNETSIRFRKSEVFLLSNQFYQNVERIRVALNYINENIEDMNLDAFFGVMLAKLYLENIKIRCRELNEVLKLSKLVLKSAGKNNFNHNYHLQNIQNYFLNEDNWKELVQTCNNSYKCNFQNNPYNLNKSKILFELLFLNFSPNGTESDMCLSEIIDMKRETNNSCGISNACYNIMMKGPSSGYSKTHRLLYLLICHTKKYSECGGKVVPILIKKTCCSIINEALIIEKIKFPSALKDLFIEQVVLCSMSGYVSNSWHRWIELVKSWQKIEGCWGYDSETLNKKICKRSDSHLGSADCSSHLTGLGVAYLAIVTNKLLCSYML